MVLAIRFPETVEKTTISGPDEDNDHMGCGMMAISDHEKNLVEALWSRFLQRRDAKPVQNADGNWHPARDGRGDLLPFKAVDLVKHLRGEVTYGTYLLDSLNRARFYTLDLDFRSQGYSKRMDPVQISKVLAANWDAPDEDLPWDDEFVECNPREVFTDPMHPLRPWLAFQIRGLAEGLAHRIARTQYLEVGVAFSGAKGVHVHAWTGTRPAVEVRAMAITMLSSWCTFHHGGYTSRFAPVDNNDTKWRDVVGEYANIDIEVFPKQDELGEDGFGNLVRLPLGIHTRTGNRSYFLNLSTSPALNPLTETDGLVALQKGCVW